MNETMQFFNHDQFGEIRVVTNTEEPLFVASDVAKALGYRMASDMTRRLDECDKGTHPVRTPSGIQIMTVINEPALFEAVLGSKIEAAQAFKRWVTHEVLPSIRKRGGYVSVVEGESEFDTVCRALLIVKGQLDERNAEIGSLRPKALLAEAVVEPSPVAYTVTEATRYLANIAPNVKRQDVFDILRATGMMCKGSTAPTRLGIDTGRMVALAGEYRDKDTGEMRAGRQRGKITCKGLAFLTEHVAGKVA